MTEAHRLVVRIERGGQVFLFDSGDMATPRERSRELADFLRSALAGDRGVARVLVRAGVRKGIVGDAGGVS